MSYVYNIYNTVHTIYTLQTIHCPHYLPEGDPSVKVMDDAVRVAGLVVNPQW